MESTTKLNSMQMFMLKIFDRQMNSKQEQEIKQLLAEYFAKQIDEEMDVIVESKSLTQKGLDKALSIHKRTIFM